MKRSSFSRHRTYSFLCLSLLLLLMILLSACSDPNSANTQNTHTNTSNTNGQNGPTPPPGIKLGAQPCPTAVSTASYWDPIVPTQANNNKVEKVMCGYLMGIPQLQAVVLVRAAGTGAILDVHVYNKITDPKPQQVFQLQGMDHGDAKISGYNTLITGEVDTESSINKNKPNAGLQMDLYREFQWFDPEGTLVPVTFPGIYPDLTRYQAEADQQQVNQGQQAWKTDAVMTAEAFAADQKLLGWNDAKGTIVSGGGKSDVDATVKVTHNSVGNNTIQVKMSRLEGNANGGIWIITDAASDGMTIDAPKSKDILQNPITVSGKGNAFEGIVGTVQVLDHLYTPIGNAQAKGATGMGNTTFSVSVPYTSTFKTGGQEGLIELYATSNATGKISGAVFIKVLLL